MAFQSHIEWKDPNVLRQKFTRAAKEFQREIKRAMFDVTWAVASQAKKNLRGGNPLHTRSGRLRASVQPGPARKEGNKIIGVVGSDIFYGRVWEFGAQTPGHIVKPRNINPRTGKVFERLAFRLGPYGAHGEAMGDWVFPKSVKMSPKPWLRPAIEKNEKFLRMRFAQVGMKALGSAKIRPQKPMGGARSI